MFKKQLENNFGKIFGFEKTTFNVYSESFEQDTLFVEIKECKPRMSAAQGGRETSTVTGSIVVFSQDNALPFGFFNKKIEQADKEFTNGLCFMNMDVDVITSPARIQNIHERRCDFIFLYDSQYDPNRGEMNQLNINVEIGD